jgi:hypothetical protein
MKCESRSCGSILNSTFSEEVDRFFGQPPFALVVVYGVLFGLGSILVDRLAENEN